MSKMSELHAAVAQAEALEQSRCVQSQETATELRAQTAEAREPVAHNIATAVGRLFVGSGVKWIGPLRELPPGEYALYTNPDPRIAELEGLLRDASQDLDDCTTDEGPVPFELKRARKTLERIRAALEKP